jgi:anti-sigma B factor antagonist
VVRLTTEVHDGVATIRIEGDVDMSNAPDLHDAFRDALSDGASSLVVDCAELTFIDSSGISALISANHEANLQWGTVTVRNPSPMVLRMLEITGLDQALTIDA